MMDRRRPRLIRASSALISGHHRSRPGYPDSRLGAAIASCRPISASSYKTDRFLGHDPGLKSDRRSGTDWRQKLVVPKSSLSPNVRRAIAIATRQAYKDVQQAFYGTTAEPEDRNKTKEARADIMLDKFLERIRRVKTGESGLKGSEHHRRPGSANISRDVVLCQDDAENEDGLMLDRVISRPNKDRRYRRPSSASVSRRQSITQRQHKPPDVKKQTGIAGYDVTESILERRERIRNRSLCIEQHVTEARERIRKMKMQRHAEMQAITAALESNQIDQERIQETAVQAARQRVWQWKVQHAGDKP